MYYGKLIHDPLDARALPSHLHMSMKTSIEAVLCHVTKALKVRRRDRARPFRISLIFSPFLLNNLQ